jgi:geranylgeranyl diphosphate synthase type II
MKALYEKYAISGKAQALKQEYMERAYQRLEEIEVVDDRKTSLFALANQLMNRVR